MEQVLRNRIEELITENEQLREKLKKARKAKKRWKRKALQGIIAMTDERALELLKIERTCISKSDTCDRNCGNCALVQDADELLDMYDFVIGRLYEK